MAATPLTAPPAAPAGPDPRALRVARWVQARVPDGDVYLFGSRARGDWEAESDIDLMVVAPAPRDQDAAALETHDALDALVTRLFGAAVRVQVLSMARAEFDWARTSPNHLAGGVQRDGLDPGGQPMPPVKQDNPWPAVQQHLRAAHRSLRTALRNAGIEDDRMTLAEAHNALENVLKAYASACGVGYAHRHWLNELLARIPAVYQEVALPPEDWLRDLSRFRAQHAYAFEPPEPPGTAEEVLEEVQRLCGPLAARVLAMCGKSPRQVGYPRYADAPWDLEQPLAGMESAHPSEFRRMDAREAEAIRQEAAQARREAAESQQETAQARQEAAESQQETAQARREALEHVAGLYHTAAALAAFAQYLDRTPAADWPALTDISEAELPQLPDADDAGEDPDPDKGGGRG